MAGAAAAVVAVFSASTALQPQLLPATTRPSPPPLALAGGIGAALGLLHTARRRRRLSAQARVERDGSVAPEAGVLAWSGWRELVLIAKQIESEEICSLLLAAPDGSPLPAYRAGQFLPIQLSLPGHTRPLRRTYSLSDYPAAGALPRHYRLSVKREPAPPGQAVPPGLVSTALHDQLEPGDTLQAMAPSGSFVLESEAPGPLVLISNGVGITPLLAIAKASLQAAPQRPLWFIHGCRNSRYQAFADELLALRQQHPTAFHLHLAYSRPLPHDRGCFQSEGHLDAGLIAQLVLDPAATYYLCGSPPFLAALLQGLRQQGVPEAAIRRESFAGRPRLAGGAAAPPAGAGCLVHFQRSGCSAVWSGTDPEQTLLQLAEQADLQPPYSCRAGVCGTCRTTVLEGDVDYPSEPTAAAPSGTALICIARPAGDHLRLDL